MTKILRRTLLLLLLGVNGCTVPVAEGPGDLGLPAAAMQEVEKNYVVPVQPDQLVNGALKGMLSKLDPHSDYMTEREYRELVAKSGFRMARVLPAGLHATPRTNPSFAGTGPRAGRGVAVGRGRRLDGTGPRRGRPGPRQWFL